PWSFPTHNADVKPISLSRAVWRIPLPAPGVRLSRCHKSRTHTHKKWHRIDGPDRLFLKLVRSD
ncbi:hypothetical protein ABTO87_18180, partial [Acinetobacter baumannii]